MVVEATQRPYNYTLWSIFGHSKFDASKGVFYEIYQITLRDEVRSNEHRFESLLSIKLQITR